MSERSRFQSEQGWPAGSESRCALASAFDFADIDALNKPFAISPEDELKAAQEQFDLEHVTFAAIPQTTGRQLAELAQISTMDMSELAFEMVREADKCFAALMEYFRNYRDCLDAYTEAQEREAADTMQANVDVLKTLGVSLRYAEAEITHVRAALSPTVRIALGMAHDEEGRCALPNRSFGIEHERYSAHSPMN
ncbi:hypothetical protein [Cupriavidus necator]|uniref:hypothetical protein n=1 Tax=Cupriavidus necator TaxID=106590 RepID=UPI001D00E904|nr:hypothetical protein [Cupriavidus necator]